MISKIELKEIFNSFDISHIIVDFNNKNVEQIRNNDVIKNKKVNINIEELTNLVIKYVTYWDKENTCNYIIDGMEAELNIYTVDEIIKYRFKNKYPYNYNEFIKTLKRMVDNV